MKRFIFIAGLLLSVSLSSSASHLMGGSLTYEYLGFNSSNQTNKFLIKLQLFRNCDTSTTPLPAQLANSYQLGIYPQDTTNPNADKILYNSYTMGMAPGFPQYVNPPSPGGACSFSTTVCVQEGVYQDTVNIPSSAGGYHLLIELCCRNYNILNLANVQQPPVGTGVGQTYYAFIPPNLIINSSPQFNDVPVPFICTSDTTSLVNTATDPDGDSLAYSFVTPYNSYTTNATPNPTFTITMPIPDVTYLTGFSLAQPFGAGGYAFIDSITGLTQYHIPTIGNYVVCVEIREYRNGVLLSTTRRDLQLIAIACNPNPPPVLSTTGGSGITTYNITEGQTLCFPVTMVDPNGDSVFVHASGSLFDPLQVNPAATLPNAAGDSIVTSQFCWTTGCGQGRSAPYQFSESALDDGCPPKITNVVYSIYVHPFAGPTVINGPDSVCNQQASVAYNVASVSGITYHWMIANGTQASGGNSSNITVNWGNSTSGIVSVYAVSQYGCTRDTIHKNVVLKPLPVADAGVDSVSFCSGQNALIGVSPTSGYTYSWNPTAGLDTSTISNPTVSLTNATTNPVTHPYTVTATLNGCSTTDNVAVIVKPLPVSNAGNDRAVCSGDTVHLGTTSTSGYIYSWTPSSGLDNTAISNPTVIVSNSTSSADTLTYYLTNNLNGCFTGDTVHVIVNPLPIVVASVNPDTICQLQTSSLQGTGANTYNWANILTPGTSIGTTNPLTVSPSIPTTYILTGTASLVGTSCINRDTVSLFVKPLPVSNAGSDHYVCSGDTVNLGVAATSGYTYQWTPSAGLNNSTVSDPFVIVANATSAADTLNYTVTSTLNGCSTTDAVKIIINPLPIVQATATPDTVCQGQTATLIGAGANTYDWANALTPSVSIGTGSSLPVNPTIVTVYIVTGTANLIGTSCINKDTVTVYGSLLPNVVATASPDSVCAGSSSTLTAVGGLSYTWAALTAPNVIVGSNPTLTITPTATVSYITTGVNSFGCINKDTVTVVYNPVPLADSIYGTTSLCPGVTGVGYLALPYTATSTYHWMIQSGTIASGQGTDTVFANWDSLSGPGFISVIETTDRGCISDTVLLPVNINLILTPHAPFGINPICEENADSSVYNTFFTPGSVYTWDIVYGTILSGNGTNNVVVNWDSTGINMGVIWYVEHSTTIDTVCYGRSDTLFVTIHPRPVTSPILGTYALCAYDTGNLYMVNPSSGSTFAWTTTSGSIASGNGTNLIHLNWSAAGTETITVVETSSFGCLGFPVDTDVLVRPLPNAYAGPDTSICFGDSTLLQATGGIIYHWTPSLGLSSNAISNPYAHPGSSSQYNVLVTDNFNCKNTDSVLVTVHTLPNANAGSNVAICFGHNTTLNASGGTQYLWIPGTGLSDSTIFNPVASPAASIQYYVIVTDNNTCHQIDSVIVTVHSLPVVDAGPDTIICNGSGTQLQATGGNTYHWSPSVGLSNVNISNPVASPADSTTYTVTVTDANNCQNTDQVFVDVNAMPRAAFNALYDPSCDGLRAKLVDLSTNELNSEWLYGDGTSQSVSNPIPNDTMVHIYPYGTTGIISLIAINNFCRDTITVEKPDIGIGTALDSLANVFSPNGDGMNDCFQVTPTGGLNDCAFITIFNRWGKVVFEGDTQHRCWDGKNDSGTECDEGVYFFIVKIGNATKNGTVQLIRKKL
ncbi:MAG: gliding motility-associated C-terminal domain-containing protein [Bacteroidetes bacterium]|nr:gliding motility-associated C-terminal domain-containing protein [Bacteroidota bacterium]